MYTEKRQACWTWGFWLPKNELSHIGLVASKTWEIWDQASRYSAGQVSTASYELIHEYEMIHADTSKNK